ncbi:pantetheine-phosphate adenylyltransferase [Candidatus Undinarchaeota archaeon]
MKGILGGTFDNFHIGHMHFIKESFMQADKLILGITSDSFANSLLKEPGNLEKLKARKANLLDYLESTAMIEDIEVVEIDDAYGPGAYATDLSKIFCTKNTKKTAESLNTKRIEKSLNPLEVVEIDLVLSSDGKPVSSTRIRKGEINQNGEPL